MSSGGHPKTVTLWVVPEGGAGPSRQIVLQLRTLQLVALAVVAIFTVAGAAVALSLSTVPRAMAYAPLQEENLELKARLLEVEGKLDTVDRELRRLRLYEEQLHAIDPTDLPGFGPTEGEGELHGVPGPDGSGVADAGEGMHDAYAGSDTGLGMGALDDLGEAELIETTSATARLDAAGDRADDILRRLRLTEIELGQVVESAESFRARSTAVPSAWPLEGVLTSGFGWRRSPFNKRWKFHFGIDVSAPIGTVIRAPAAGLVVTAEYHSGYGRMLEIDHGYDVVSRYAHNARLLVGLGETVRAGQPISTVGMTGATTGPHLHYEIYVEGQPVDPLEHLD